MRTNPVTEAIDKLQVNVEWGFEVTRYQMDNLRDGLAVIQRDTGAGFDAIRQGQTTIRQDAKSLQLLTAGQLARLSTQLQQFEGKYDDAQKR